MIGVIGGGAFGTALAIALASDGTDVRLWMRAGARQVNNARENAGRLSGALFPDTLIATGDLADLAEAKAVLLVLPAQETAGFWARSARDLPHVPMVLCAKGLTRDGARLQSDLVVSEHGVAVLTGPGFAGEIARGHPTALTLAGAPDLAQGLQALLSRPSLRLYRSDDMVGAQLGGALKNVIAIAAGVAIGAGLGESARAAIVTRGFAEMRRLARAMGAQDATLTGLSGLGDLMLTTASEKSRNFSYGVSLVAGADQATATTEGIATAGAVVSLGEKFAVDLPISKAVLQVLSGASVDEVMTALLSRPLRAE